MKDKIYDILKYATMYVIPAIGIFYLAIANIWGLPYGNEVNQTIIAVEAFLAVILGISNITYKKEEE